MTAPTDPVDPELLVQRLEWRYAVRKFDPARRIHPATWDALERTLVLTPSSFGLQPWTFLVVDGQRTRAELVAASWNQRQVADASHLVVFAIRKGLAAPDVDRYVARICEVRGVSAKSLERYRRAMVGFVEQPPECFDVDEWSTRQVYIALGNFMTAAALLGVDTCPMEGIVPAQYDAVLGLAPKRLATVVACCAGYRSADDENAKKVRFERRDVVEHI